MCLRGPQDFNRRKKLNKIITEDFGPNIEFTVYDVLEKWEHRWSRVPSIKELSKVMASNPALDSHKNGARGCFIYMWDGEKDLSLYIIETDEDLVKYRDFRKGI